MISRKLIVPALAVVAASVLALLWMRYAPWPAMVAEAPVAAPPPAQNAAGGPADERAELRRREAQQAIEELERRLTVSEERAARLHETLTSDDLNYRVSAARRLLEIAHAPHEALELLQQTLRLIEGAPDMETERQALNDDIARLSKYMARSPRRAMPVLGELLAMLESAPSRASADGAGPDTGYWRSWLARLPDQLKAAVRVERHKTLTQDDTRLLRHMLLRARLAVLENDAQAFDVLTADIMRLAGERSGEDAELHEALARLRSLDMQWHPPSLGAAFAPSQTGAE